jgi:uncharacterized protein YecE (DUF72 family)
MTDSSALRVGCCGFPVPLPRYAQAFSVVEVQQTFYQPPRLNTLEKWRALVPRNFEFTLKAWQLITHETSSPTYRRLREKLTEVQKREAGSFRFSDTVVSAWWRTLECAQALGSRVILFQCPARFKPTSEHKANLQNFFREIRKGIGPAAREFVFVWEPRGEWKPEEVRELCEELNLVHGVDPLQEWPVTQEIGYFRLHGKSGYRYHYTDDDLARLLETITPFSPCYVLFNNVSMLADAERFLSLVRTV